MSMREAFAAHEAAFREWVFHDTWGHLAAKPRVKYPGRMLFARSGYGSGYVLLSSSFEGLDDSPWLFEAMQDFIESRRLLKYGAVYRWTGTCMFFKNGRAQFSGTVKLVFREAE